MVRELYQAFPNPAESLPELIDDSLLADDSRPCKGEVTDPVTAFVSLRGKRLGGPRPSACVAFEAFGILI